MPSESCCIPPVLDRSEPGSAGRDDPTPDAPPSASPPGEPAGAPGGDTSWDAEGLPVAVIGAGPVGLAAAAHLVRRGQEAVVLEAGNGPGASVREWSHVRLFSPWNLCIDPVAEAMLTEAGWDPPLRDALPTGGDLVERYLEPLARLPRIRSVLRYRHRVVGVARAGRDRLKGASTSDRSEAPFVLRYEKDGTPGHLRARAVIDASGTWTRPRPLGADGLPALGEEDAADRIHYGLPDVLRADRGRYANRRIAVVGAGHSAANVLLDLTRLKVVAPETVPLWVLRGDRPEGVFDASEDDDLRARGELERRIGELVRDGLIAPVANFGTRAVERREDATVLVDDSGRTVQADRVVGVTGFRPDLEMLGELRLDLDPLTEAPRALGPLIDPNVHSCGTVPPHGEEELRHPEPGFYLVGMKSYGRAPTFLLPTGYEQVRSVAASLSGDAEAAGRVELTLPETGVCSADAALVADESGQAATPVVAGGGSGTEVGSDTGGEEACRV